jgi:geranylgeranyl diphosphate synthase type II
VTSGDRLAAFFAEARARIDRALDRYLPAPPGSPALVCEAMRYSVFAGGKRLRPILGLAAADAVSRAAEGDHAATTDAALWPACTELALPAACAIELIHTYSLIHDDLPAMDNDTLRRGRPTLHMVYGDGVAVLAGDGLQAEAFSLLAREPADEDEAIVRRKVRTFGIVAAAAGAAGMVGGQAIDLEAAGQVPGRTLVLDGDGLRAMHARKTGAMIRAAATSGAVMAGGDERAIAAVDQYAAELGLAFQIVDDILDVEGSADQLGKTAGKDAAATKPSYPALFGVERSRMLAAECGARARHALEAAAIADGHLGAIVDWVVSRRS